MKPIYSIALTFIVHCISFGQAKSQPGVDCNPKLSPEDISFFKTLFPADTFDFYGKNIGFATNDGVKIWGFENSFMPISKKKYFNLYRNDTKRKLKVKLLILDSVQKQTTTGFDAIMLSYDKKYEKKAEESKFRRLITVFGYRQLNYPDNLALVGNDTSAVLTAQEASFFNQIFEHSRGIFDFNGKNIAIVVTQTKSVVPKSEFINKVKKHLEEDFLYPYDFLYILNDKEKKETGGIDAVIIYDCLKCGGWDAVAILKRNRT